MDAEARKEIEEKMSKAVNYNAIQEKTTPEEIRKKFPEVAAADAMSNLHASVAELNQRPRKEIEQKYMAQIQDAMNDRTIQAQLEVSIQKANLDTTAEQQLRKAVNLAKTDEEAQTLINQAMQAKRHV